MGIWEHADINSTPSLGLVHSARKRCDYCSVELESHKPGWEWAQFDNEHLACFDTVSVCPVCGWWISERRAEGNIIPDDERGPNGEEGPYGTLLFASVGVLKSLDIGDISTPIEEVRAFLAARYEKRFDVHPRLMEETVGSVFSDLGYSAVVTGYSGDDGVDVILSDGSQGLVGVQVKRYKNRITVEQIRALAGALVLGGYTRGVFVTTSGFESGAFRTSRRFADRGIPIDLVDARRFLETLRLAQIESYRGRSKDQVPFSQPPPMRIATSYYSCSQSTDFYALDEPQRAPWAGSQP
jgi:restriction system protein